MVMISQINGIVKKKRDLKERINVGYTVKWASVAQTVKNLAVMQETRVPSLSQEDPWRREWQPTPVFLPGWAYGQKSLVGYSPWCHKESDTTEWLTLELNKILLNQWMWARLAGWMGFRMHLNEMKSGFSGKNKSERQGLTGNLTKAN